jgi:4-hydroxy-tetrahydrodipicolinate synthase
MRPEFETLKDELDSGVVPATVTPLTPDYDVDVDSLHRHIGNLSAVDGIVGLMANAHSGESSMTPTDVKAEVVREHIAAAGDDARVFSGVSGESTTQAVAEAKVLEEAGAEALMPVPIAVQSNGDPQVVWDHYRGIADAVDIPLIAFQFGNYGDITLPVGTFVELCTWDEVIALKDASWTYPRYEETVRALDHIRDEFTLLNGNDTFMYHAYHLGADGALIGYANLIPEMHVEKLRAVQAGDLDRARELRREMMPLTNFVWKDPVPRYRQRTKSALEMQGVFEHDTVRPPQQPLPAAEKDELRNILQDLDRL